MNNFFKGIVKREDLWITSNAPYYGNKKINELNIYTYYKCTLYTSVPNTQFFDPFIDTVFLLHILGETELYWRLILFLALSHIKPKIK